MVTGPAVAAPAAELIQSGTANATRAITRRHPTPDVPASRLVRRIPQKAADRRPAGARAAALSRPQHGRPGACSLGNAGAPEATGQASSPVRTSRAGKVHAPDVADGKHAERRTPVPSLQGEASMSRPSSSAPARGLPDRSGSSRADLYLTYYEALDTIGHSSSTWQKWGRGRPPTKGGHRSAGSA
jgi:hypothetical protein